MTVINVTEGGLAMDNAYWNGSAIFGATAAITFRLWPKRWISARTN
jgi:hypothetical protein